MAEGTIDDPLTLSEALTSGRIRPGHTVYLRGGTHALTGDLTATLSGTAELPIVIRPYQNEEVAIDVGTFDLMISGAHLTFYDIRIFSSDTQGRESEEYTSSPSDVYLGHFSIVGNEINLFGCVIHDVANVGQWASGPGGHWADCVVYNCGWLAPGGAGPWGHSLYSQNLTSTRYFTRCMWGPSYGTVGVRGSTAANLYHYRFSENVCLHANPRLGGYGATIHDAQFTDSVLLRSPVHLEFAAVDDGLIFSRNFVETTGHLRTQKLAGLVFTYNEWIQDNLWLLLMSLNDDGQIGTFDYNTYYGPEERRRLDDVYYDSLAVFQADTGQETHSSRMADPPAARTWVFECEHSLYKKAFIAMYDRSEPESVTFDVSGLQLVPGASYKLRSGYDYLGDTEDIEYDGSGAITVSMAGRTVAVPNGAEAALVEVNPTVGAWTLERIA